MIMPILHTIKHWFNHFRFRLRVQLSLYYIVVNLSNPPAHMILYQIQYFNCLFGFHLQSTSFSMIIRYDCKAIFPGMLRMSSSLS